MYKFRVQVRNFAIHSTVSIPPHVEYLLTEKGKDLLLMFFEIGKIAFGINYGGRKAEEGKAVATAIQAYKDGLFRIFLGEEELTDLSQRITLFEGDSLTFIKLTMLSR